MQNRNSPLRSSLCNGLICPLSIKLSTGDFRDSRTLKVMLHGTIRNDNFQQHSVRVVMLGQCCHPWKQCRNNVATLYSAKNRLCESSHETSPLKLPRIIGRSPPGRPWVQKQSQFTKINCLHLSNEVKSLMMVVQQEIIEFFVLLYEWKSGSAVYQNG